jgi:hypothetical protein
MFRKLKDNTNENILNSYLGLLSFGNSGKVMKYLNRSIY